ncbi:hypothetical protein PBS_35980 [Paraburkholderia sp. 2C]|jgi:hypothetical protein
MKCKWPDTFLAGAAVAAVVILCSAIPSAAADDAASEPNAPVFSGKSVTRSNAVVLGVDPKRNSVTLWEETGEPVEIVVDKALGPVKALQMGDKVEITYSRALLLRTSKSGADDIRKRVDSDVTSRASTGASMSMHRVEAVATVTNIDRDKRMLTLRGPDRSVTMQASSTRLLDGLRVGESLRVDYIEATAIHITRDGLPLR